MKLYTQREVAALLRVTVRTIERMREKYRKEGRQFGVKVGGSVRFTQEHIDMVLKPEPPAPDPRHRSVPGTGEPARVMEMREAARRGREIAQLRREQEAVRNDPTAAARLRGRQIAREVKRRGH